MRFKIKTRLARTWPERTRYIVNDRRRKRDTRASSYIRATATATTKIESQNSLTWLIKSIPRFLLRLYVFSQVRLPPFPIKTSPQKIASFFFFPCHDPIFWSWISFYLCVCFDLDSSMPFFSCCTKASLCYSPGRFVSNSCFLHFYSHCRNLEHGGYVIVFLQRFD